MSKNTYAPDFKDLPESIPVFPLTGVLLLPNGQLPLNIFEKRYLDMVDAALSSHRLIGMIQPEHSAADRTIEDCALSAVGCVGKIVDFSETSDGRYLITPSGVCRFKVHEELSVNTPYRQIKPDWETYKKDLGSQGNIDLDRDLLHELLSNYFDKEGLDCDWSMVEKAADEKLITCLSMICPFEPQEKQALLEASCCNKRSELFMTMLEMAVKSIEACADTKH